LTIVQFNVFGASSPTLCIAPLTPVDSLLTGIWVPVLCFGLLVFIFLVHLLCWWLSRKSLDRYPRSKIIKFIGGPKKFWKSPYIRTSIGLCVYSYNSFVLTTMQFFDCPEVGGDRVVHNFPAISCTSSEYKALYPLFAFVIVILVLFTVSILATLLYARRRGYFTVEKQFSVDRIKFSRRYGILFECYKPECFYWEVVMLIRRAVAIFLLTLMSTNRPLSYTWLSILHIIMVLVVLELKPYPKNLENVTEAVSLSVLAIICMIITSASYPLSGSTSASVGLTVLVSITAVALTVKLTYGFYLRRISKKKSPVPPTPSQTLANHTLEMEERPLDN